MRALSGELLLAAWERACGEPELGRPLGLLAVAMPGSELARLRDLPIVERNRLLLTLHELSFGSRLDVVVTCQACDAPFEFSIPTSELATGETVDRVTWTEAGRSYRLRAATTSDLLATLAVTELDAAADLLVDRCLEVTPADVRVATATVIERFDELHAVTELTCPMSCPVCESEQLVDLDIARFVWIEVRRAASRLLRAVHSLAAAYGWSEQSILELDDSRRNAYLEMVGA